MPTWPGRETVQEAAKSDTREAEATAMSAVWTQGQGGIQEDPG